MIGQEGAIDLVRSRLEIEMPAKVAELIVRYADNLILRPPAAYKTWVQTRIEADQYPMIEIGPRDDAQPTWLNQDAGVQNYNFTYNMRIYLIERGNSYFEVEKRRQRLTLGVREVLTSAPLLSETPQAWVSIGSVHSVYFGTGEVNEADNRSIAATYTDLSVIVGEMTEPFSLSGSTTATTIISTVHPSARTFY